MTALRTRPEPAKSELGLDNVLAVSAALAFNGTLLQNPNKGLYYEADTQHFSLIWRELSKEGCIRVANVNTSIHFELTLKQCLGTIDPIDDRWTCAGLAEVLLHVGRAIVHLSYCWERGQPKNFAEDYPGLAKFLSPAEVYGRVVDDLVLALLMPPHIVKALLGAMQDCRKLQNTKLFPDVEWVSIPSRQQTRPPLLWDALRLEAEMARSGP